MPSRPVKALLAIEPGVDAEQVQASLPADDDFSVVGMVSGADEALRWLRDSTADMLLVACAGYSDRALLLLDAVTRQDPDLTVVVLGHGSPNGSLRRAFEAGLAVHSSGVRTLIAPRRPDQASAVGAELLREVYSILRNHFDWVIVDTPPGFTAEVITSIDSSTDVVMVGMLDSLSLKNTKLGLETLELMKYDPDHIYLLLNRAHSRVGISQSDVEAVLGRTPDVFIPSDREIPRTVNEGIPIVVARPQSEPAEAFARLAELLAGPSVVQEPVVAQAGEGGSLLRLFGRKA